MGGRSIYNCTHRKGVRSAPCDLMVERQMSEQQQQMTLYSPLENK